MVKLDVTVSYGNLDVYGTEPKCTYTSTTPQECKVDILSIKEGTGEIRGTDDRPKRIQYTNFIDLLIDKKLLTVVGKYRSVVLAMKNLKYR